MVRRADAGPSPGQERGVGTKSLHFCPLYGINISKPQCRDKTSVYTVNQRTCTGEKCTSPWRLCLSCISQGRVGDEAVVIDPEKGLCQFHKERGLEARREGQPTAKNEVVLLPVPVSRSSAIKTSDVADSDRRSSAPVGGNGGEQPMKKEKAAPTNGTVALEVARELQQKIDGGATAVEIAEERKRSAVWVYAQLKLLKLHPDATAALKTGRLSVYVASRLAALASDQQVGVLKEILEKGLKNKKAFGLIRRAAGPAGQGGTKKTGAAGHVLATIRKRSPAPTESALGVQLIHDLRLGDVPARYQPDIAEALALIARGSNKLAEVARAITRDASGLEAVLRETQEKVNALQG